VKRIVTSYPVSTLGVLLGILIGVISVPLNISGPNAIIVVISELTLANTIEIMVHVRGLRALTLLPSVVTQMMLSDSATADHVRQILTCYADAKKVPHRALREQLRQCMSDNLADLQNLSTGAYMIRLQPRPYFRSLAVLDEMRSELMATSLVKVQSYWEGVSGRNYLARQAEVLRRLGVQECLDDPWSAPIQRIFIQEQSRVRDLLPVLSLHRQFGIAAFVAFYHEVPAELREDFMVLDRNLYVHLDLDVNGESVTAGFVVRGGGRDDEVDAARRRFELLKRHCQLPAEIPELADALAD
jgi:hypothetical protein